MGAVAAFLCLAVVGLIDPDSLRVRAAYLAMDIITRAVIVPLAVAALVTGVVQSLGTPWGLFRHYWVIFKLLLTVLATAVLLIHTRPIRLMAQAAAVAPPAAELHRIRIQLIVDAAAGLLVLLIATVLAIYKPRGVTPWAGVSPAGAPPAVPTR
ncbi:MAG TPA: hypothetical protein VGF45_00590 [Polyangia bacterium]